MEIFNSKKFIVLMLLVLMCVGISGCANKKVDVVQGPSQGSDLDSIAKMKSIGAVIGCIFAPADEECKKLKENKIEDKPHESQEEYDKKVNEEWDEMEKQ